MVDAYSAMVTDRVYKARLTHEEALAELLAWRGKQFDPDIVDLFIAWNAADLSERFFDDERQTELLRDALTILVACRTKDHPGFPVHSVHQELQSLMIWNSLLDSAQNSIEAQDILRAVQHQVERLIKFDRMGVLLARHDDVYCTIHEIVIREGLAPVPNGTLLPVRQSGFEFLAKHKRPYAANDVANHPEFAEDGYLASVGVRSILRLPLLKGDTVYGIMTFKSTTAHRLPHVRMYRYTL